MAVVSRWLRYYAWTVPLEFWAVTLPWLAETAADFWDDLLHGGDRWRDLKARR